MQKIKFLTDFKVFLFTGMGIIMFSNFVIELFGQTIPNIVWSFFRDVGGIIIVASVFAFMFIWILKTKPHIKPKNYSIISYDVFGNESNIDGLRSKFKTHDVAWSFMKQYKRSYPLYNFALVSEQPKSTKKTIFRYI